MGKKNRNRKSGSDISGPEDEAEEFVVEDILDYRRLHGKGQFLLKWDGYDEPTWEVESNVVEPKREFKKKMETLKARYGDKQSAGSKKRKAESSDTEDTGSASRKKRSEHSSSRRYSPSDRNCVRDIAQKQLSVKNLSKLDDSIWAVVTFEDGETQDLWVPLKELREMQPQPVIDFLVNRIRFN